MMMCAWTDRPEVDAERYYADCEQQMAIYEAKCMKCECCGKPINPNYEEFDFQLDDDLHICTDCYNKLMKKVEEALGENSFFADWLDSAAREVLWKSSYVPD